MSVLVSNPHSVVLIAPPESRRVTVFQSSLKKLHWPLAQVISYQEVISHPELLPSTIKQGTIVRLETSGESCDTDRLLLALGKALSTPAIINDVTKLRLEQGEIIPSNQWYKGLSLFLEVLQQQLADCATHYLTFDVKEIMALFDKTITSQQWHQQGLTVPYAMNQPFTNLEELIALLAQHNLTQVFIKLAHGSAASGTLALRVKGNKIKAITTIEMVRHGGQIHCYNSAKLQQYTDWPSITLLIDELLKYHKLQLEAWIPKALWQNQRFDLRVVVIAGNACHSLMRCSDDVMTNLHLAANQRGDIAALKTSLAEQWHSVMELAEQAMQSFPKSLYAGVDILLSKGLNKPYLLEANAFGDFHPNTYFQGLDTYQMELLALLNRAGLS